jgi:hypothetical protein
MVVSFTLQPLYPAGRYPVLSFRKERYEGARRAVGMLKVKFPLCLTKSHAMKACLGVENLNELAKRKTVAREPLITAGLFERWEVRCSVTIGVSCLFSECHVNLAQNFARSV